MPIYIIFRLECYWILALWASEQNVGLDWMDDGLDTPKTVMTTRATRQIFFGQQDGLQVTTKLSFIFLQQDIFPHGIKIQEIHVFPDADFNKV